MAENKKSMADVSGFYDEFSKNQLQTGVNLRHYHLFNQLVKAGLKKNSSVLEIGCGIGTLTQLMASYLKKGKIHATDISPENVSVATKRLSRFRGVSFDVTDMKGFNSGRTYDFIVLADVIEHIPIAEHSALFHTIARHTHRGSVLFMNIPHPKAIEFLEKSDPASLQIIDQPVYAGLLVATAEASGFMLSGYSAYSLFKHQHDYVLAVFVTDSDIDYTPVTRLEIIVRKLWLRFSYYLRTMC